MKQVTINLYEYHELNEKAQAKARQWLHESNIYDQWWLNVYDDAAQAGLELKNFESDSYSRVYGLEGTFTKSAPEVAEYILENHGAACDTYEAAKSFILEALDKDDDALETLGEVFLDDLLKCYAKALQAELDYQNSDAYAVELIEANEYTFLASGERYEAGV